MFNLTNLVWQGVSNRTFKVSVLATTIASMSILTACSSTPQNKKPSTTNTINNTNNAVLDADELGNLEDLLYATDMRAVETDRLQILRYGDVWKRITVGYGMDLNRYDPRIEAQRSWFTSRQPYIDRLSARASRYLHYTVKEAERRGLPTELALLPIIESSYDPAATSSAAAAGLWQFIPSTGKIYGLRQSDLYDGRRDVVESTRAAYEYLSSLYNQFGSWELALASYNAGPGRIQQAINRNKAAGLPTDYWSLKLPQETMYYVPRFIAVAQIIKNPQAYNVSLPPIANRPHFREVTLPGAVDLNELSKITGVSRGELYALNPGHRGNYTDPLAPRRILLPNDVHTSIDAKITKMPTVSGSGGLWAVETAPLPVLNQSTTSNVTTTVVSQPSSALVTNQPSQLPTSAPLTTAVTTATKPVQAATSSVATTAVSTASSSLVKVQKTPVGSQALANFANSADIPSAPRVPLSITPTTPVAQVKTVVEPPISEAERKALVALIEQEEKTDQAKAEVIVQQIVEPKTTVQETQEIVKELAEIAPKGTEIIDPLDGAIKLTALQTSQSIAEQKGEESKLGYAYPRAVAEAERNSADALRNQGKPVIQTPKDVVVVAPQGKRDVYTVQAGDTLATIASRFGVNWRDIANWNQIEASNPLFVGTRLYLYNAKPVEVKTPAVSKPTRHVVKAGDTLTGISQQYNISLQDLAAWNNLSVTSNVLIGQNLHLIEPKDFKAKVEDQRAKDTKQVASTPKIETEQYTVKSGEFFKVIADRYGLSVSELVALTPGLSVNSTLLVGQKINVPKQQVEVKETKPAQKPQFETITYTVSAGDNLSLVAQKHKMTLAEIAELNKLKTNTTILVGQKLEVKKVAPERPSNYRVLSGDTLSAVATKFNLSVAQLAGMNGLKTNAMLRSGQVLKLDGELQVPDVTDNSKKETKVEAKVEDVKSNFSGSTESYTVKSGDNLTVLAQRYQITVADLAALNKLTAKSSLRVGQKINVPKLTTTYTVKRGDTLIGLSKKFGLSVDELAQMNSIKADTQVRLGQTLTVPN